MRKLAVQRLLQLGFVLFFLSVLTFTMMKLAPGDPVLAMLNADQHTVTKEEEARLHSELGFQRPVLEQYAVWASGVLQLDLGKSYLTGKPVWEEMVRRLPATIQLAFGALAVMLCLAVPLGLLSAKYKDGWVDRLGRFLALAGASMPSFWLGLLLIYVFSYQLKWLPSVGRGTGAHLLLPSITLGLSLAAVYARLLRAGILDSLAQNYIRSARARGLAEWRIFFLHAFRAALLPIVTVFGMSMGSLLGGTVVVEVMFSWPGLGSLVMDAIFGRDYPVIQGYVLLTGFIIVMTNLLVDISYYVIDPRIRYGKGAMR